MRVGLDFFFSPLGREAASCYLAAPAAENKSVCWPVAPLSMCQSGNEKIHSHLICFEAARLPLVAAAASRIGPH